MNLFRCVVAGCVIALGGVSYSQELNASEVFQSTSLFKISVETEKSKWESCDDETGNRKSKSTKYDFKLSNDSTIDLLSIRGSYCVYRDRDDYIEADLHEIKDLDSVDAGLAVTCDSGLQHMSFKRSSPHSFLNEVIGIRARFVMTLEDGSELVREVTVPKSLSAEKYPWKEVADSSSTIDPTQYPDKELSEKEVKTLVKQYIKAMEREDFDAWLQLLSPMHPGHEDLNKAKFMGRASRIRSIDIEDIDGLNVELELVSSTGYKSVDYLQIHSSGYIKYTPYVFKHPVSIALISTRSLYHEDVMYRNSAVRSLKELGIPLFGYNANSGALVYEAAAGKVRDWFYSNGREFDPSEPKVFIYKKAFIKAWTDSEPRF